jgi:hypothetical protein
MQLTNGEEVDLLILDLDTRRCERSASRLSYALPPGKDPVVHWIGDLVDLRDGVDAETRRDQTPVVQSVCRLY